MTPDEERDLAVLWGVIQLAETLGTKSTFARGKVAGHEVIACLLCRRVSYHSKDIEQRYCGHCHIFHDAVSIARQLHADGGTHECGEWRSGAGKCAVCGAVDR